MPGSSNWSKYIVILETFTNSKKDWILALHALKSRTVLRSLARLLPSSHRCRRLRSFKETVKSQLDFRKVEIFISGKMLWATGSRRGSAIEMRQQFCKRRSRCLSLKGKVRITSPACGKRRVCLTITFQRLSGARRAWHQL